VTWSRKPVADYLVTLLGQATAGSVKIHPSPPEIVNGPCVVVARPVSVRYKVVSFCQDEATLPLVLVSGIEQEESLDSLKGAVIAAIAADPTLGGTVAQATPTEERGWRNLTGAGGTQLLLVELILTVWM